MHKMYETKRMDLDIKYRGEELVSRSRAVRDDMRYKKGWVERIKKPFQTESRPLAQYEIEEVISKGVRYGGR